MNAFFKNLLRFCIIILLQVLILNKITLRWWSEPAGFPVFIPYVYPLYSYCFFHLKFPYGACSLQDLFLVFRLTHL
jgi:hypothetical protein